MFGNVKQYWCKCDMSCLIGEGHGSTCSTKAAKSKFDLFITVTTSFQSFQLTIMHSVAWKTQKPGWNGIGVSLNRHGSLLALVKCMQSCQWFIWIMCVRFLYVNFAHTIAKLLANRGNTVKITLFKTNQGKLARCLGRVKTKEWKSDLQCCFKPVKTPIAQNAPQRTVRYFDALLNY